MATIIFDRSIFKQYFDADDVEAQAWADNVLEKLVQPGQVAKYVKREDEDGEETEFRRLFAPMVQFLSYFVRFAREFRDFKEDDFLSDLYLNNQGQYTGTTESLVQLKYLITNLLRIRRQRGSLDMVAISEDVDVPSGELLRLLNWDLNTFFKMGLARPQRTGWNLNNSSPLHRGCTGRYDLNIAWEYTEDVVDQDRYPLINGGYVSLASYRGKNCMQVTNVPLGQQAGIGGASPTLSMVVDTRINFEISFYVAQDVTLENLTFGVRAYNAVGAEVSLVSVVDNSERSWFFETRRLNQAGRFYLVRGIIYSKLQPALTETQARLNVGFGSNLKFIDDVVRVVPYILLDNNAVDDSDLSSDYFSASDVSHDLGDSGVDSDGAWSDSSYDGDPSVFIWNVKVTPCSTQHERSYLNNKNFVDIFLDNNSGRYSDLQIQDMLRRYFIPYNTAFNSTFLNELSETPPVVGGSILLETGGYLLLESGGHLLLE